MYERFRERSGTGPAAGRRRQCGRRRSYIFGEPRHRVEAEQHGDRPVRRVKRGALRLGVLPRRGWRPLVVAGAAALVLLMATACATGGGPDRQATAAQESTGTSGAPAAEATVLDLTFSPSAGTGLVARFSLRCDRDARFLALAARVCEALAQREEALLPASMTACPLPTGVFVLTVKGTIGGNEIDRFYAPCSSPERTVIATWMSLLQFRPGVL
jgi:hypothetical protein